jgi:hypothetical protein
MSVCQGSEPVVVTGMHCQNELLRDGRVNVVETELN